MAQLIITEHGLKLTKKRERLIVQRDGEVIEELHFAHLEGISLFGITQLTGQVMHKLLQTGIPVSFFTEDGFYQGGLVAGNQKLYNVKMAQIKQYGLMEKELFYAKKTIQAKLKLQTMAIKQRRRLSQTQQNAMKEIHDAVECMYRKVDSVQCIDELRGIEGNAAKCYFQSFDVLITDAMKFEYRSRRPLHNEINSLMSYSYGIMYQRILSMMPAVGLDGYLGFFHQERYNRANLVLDFLELWRPGVDAFILKMIRKKQIKQSDFVMETYPKLSDQGKKKFIGFFQLWYQEKNHNHMMQEILRMYGTSLVKGDCKTYEDGLETLLPYLL